MLITLSTWAAAEAAGEAARSPVGILLAIIGLATTYGGYLTARTWSKVKVIDRAVNHVPPGTPTLISQVSELRQAECWNRQAVQMIAARLGVDLPPHPSEHPEEYE